MRTVDETGILYEWEFKIRAGYAALGQVITYVGLARRHVDFQKTIRGVLAAFDFHQEVADTVEVMNLGIELVTIPRWMARAGAIPVSVVPDPEEVLFAVPDQLTPVIIPREPTD